MQDSDEHIELKRAFAREALKYPSDNEGRFKAASVVTGDPSLMLRLANQWFNESVVVEEQKRLASAVKDDSLDFIGTKAEFAREVLARARSEEDGDTAAKFFKLYADARGFITKPESNVNVSVTNNRVMVVKDMGTNDEWAAKARAQQANLINANEPRKQH